MEYGFVWEVDLSRESKNAVCHAVEKYQEVFWKEKVMHIATDEKTVRLTLLENNNVLVEGGNIK